MRATSISKTRPPYRPPASPITTIRPPQIPYFRVTDEESFEKALPIVAEGPVMIACASGRDYYVNDFDQAANVMSEELSIGGVCTVYPGKLEVHHKKLKPLPKPEPPPGPYISIARVVDEITFDKATELIAAGPVDIKIGTKTYNSITDFDQAMELITNALLMKVHPVVYGGEERL